MTSSRLVVAAAVLDSLSAPGALLCAARSYPAEHAGQYEFPGGKVEAGETPHEALVRELREEIGVPVRLGPELPPTDGSPTWPAMHGYRMRVWLAEPADPDHGPQRGGAHESVQWVTWDDLGALPWLEADLPILAAIRTAATPPRAAHPF